MCFSMNLYAIKVLLIAINIFLFVVGGCLLTLGYILVFETEAFSGYLAPLLKVIPAGGGTGSDIWTLYNYAAISFIAVGSVTVLIGVTGCLLGTCPNKFAAVLYLAALGMIILSQATGSAILVITDIDSTLMSSLSNNLLRKYAGDEAVDEYSQAWNYVFVKFDCCGIESYDEFDRTVYWNRKKIINGNITEVTIPETCCHLPGDYPDYGLPSDPNCTVSPTVNNSYILQGCLSPLQAHLWYYHKLLILCETIPLLFEIVALVLALLVTSGLRNRKSLLTTKGKTNICQTYDNQHIVIKPKT